jgi:hypothetical protein
MVVGVTSVHPGCALHPVHPGCTSGYGDGWAGMLATARFGLYASFSAPAGPGNGLGQHETPGKAKNKLQQNCLARINQVNACEIRFGARLLMELPLVPLSASDKVRAHRFLFSPCALKIRVFRQRASPLNNL